MNKYYKYKGIKCLMPHMNNPPELYDNLYMCAYNVNNQSKYPFQRFLLVNTEYNKTMSFPRVKITKKFNKNTDEFLNFVKVSLFGLFQLYMDNFSVFNSELAFNGFYEYENNLYMFFDVTDCNIRLNDVYKSNNLWFATIEEIINVKYFCDMPIGKDITNFFSCNESFCFLLDDKNNNYEIPMIGYVGKSDAKVKYTYIFGETKNDDNGMFGPYYYFTNFFNSLNKEYAVRFAIFVGFTKYIENEKFDSIDNSETKKQRLKDKTVDQNFERLTMRITDYDGKWTEHYDSVILGKIELDNGSYIKAPIIVVKEYEQQTPLSYHYVNKTTIVEKSHNLIL